MGVSDNLSLIGRRRGWALIRGWSLINVSAFRMGAYSRLGAYSNKYGIYLDTTTFVMRSVFVVLETTGPQI